MVAAPFFTTLNACPLDAAQGFFGEVSAARRHPTPRLFHIVVEGMEHTDYNHAICPTVQAGMDAGRYLIATIPDPRVWEDQYAARVKRARQIPLSPAFQVRQRAGVAQRRVFAGVESVNIFLQLIELIIHIISLRNVLAY
jgi:hypothetical protein